jgi:signal transduction histidine kinase
MIRRFVLSAGFKSQLAYCHFLLKKLAFITGFLFVFWPLVFGQRQPEADSLELIYINGDPDQQNQLKLLHALVEKINDPDKLLLYSNALIEEAERLDSVRYLFIGYLQKGNALRFKSDLDNALKAYFYAARIAPRNGLRGATYVSIADVYSIMGNHNNAVAYYQKAIVILKQERDSTNWANALYNLSDHYLKNNAPDSALAYTLKAQYIFGATNDQIGEAYCLGNLGKIYALSGNRQQAELNLTLSISLLEALNEYNAICEFLVSMSDISLQKKDFTAAGNYARKSFELARKYGLKKEMSDASLKLSELYEKAGETALSFSYYKEYIKYRDSVSNIEAVQKMADLRTDFEVSEKQKEVDLLATRNKLRIAERNGFIFASLLLAAILFLSIFFYTQKAKRNRLLAAQKMQEKEIAYQKALLESVITSQEAERKRIGMDLHDEVGAALSTLRMKIEQNASGTVPHQEAAGMYKTDIDRIIANMRHIAHSLSPRISGNYGFYDAIHEIADQVNRVGKINMIVNFDEHNLPFFVNEQMPMALYRVVAELVNNTLKHAAAKTIRLDVDVAADKMIINYSDDGIGNGQIPGINKKGMGMQNIESRLGMIGALWELYKPENGGYGIVITVQLK